MPQETWDFDQLSGSVVTADAALAQPGAVNAQVAQAITESTGDAPEPPEPWSDTQVPLPGGVYWDGDLLRVAEVREMTGADEEELARVKGSLARWLTVLLERCVVRVGNVTPTPELLIKLLVGDRDALLLGVRIATFGPHITARNVQCPHCNEYFSATVDLRTVDCVRLDEPRPRHEYEVPLRNDRTAIVRLPDGATAEKMFKADDSTHPERETALLSECVVRVNDAQGESLRLTGPLLARSLGSADRRTIIKHIAETAPGPRIDNITFDHEACGKEVSLPIDIGELFRGE